MGSALFARMWCACCVIIIAILGIFNVYIGIAYDIPPSIAYQHTFFVIASLWMLPPLLLFAVRWQIMYEWYLRNCKKKQPQLDPEYQTRLMVIVFGCCVCFSLYVTYKDYAEVAWHITIFKF